MSVLLTSEQIPSALRDHLPPDLQSAYVAHYLVNAPLCQKYLHNRYCPEQSVLGRCRVQLEKIGDQWQPSQEWSTAPEQLRFYELPNWFAEHAAEDEHHYHSLSRKDRVHLIKHIENLDPETFAVDVTEVYSPVRMTNPALCKRQGLVPGSSLDLRTGWNFGLRNHRENAIRLVDAEDPELLVLSPMCDQFSQMNRINEARRDPQQMQTAWDTAIMHFRFAVKLCRLRHQRGKKFLLEQPWLAESWRERDCVKLQREPGVRWVHGPQCAFGLQVAPDGRLSRKETGWLTNCDEIADAVVKPCTCPPGGHATLESGLAKKAQTYPPRLCEAVLKALRKYLDRRDAASIPATNIHAFPEVVEPMEPIPEMEPYFPGRRVPEQDENLDDGDGLDVTRFEPAESPQPYTTGFVPTKEQLADIQMAHDNAGHPENIKFARYLRLGGARRDVCNWIRANFRCSSCASTTQPKAVRPVGIPRSYRANYVVGLDCIDIPGVNDGPAEPWLNSLCWGTAYQSVDRLPRLEVEDPEMTPFQRKTSLNVWVCFATNWIKFLGPPEILVTDQGTEFMGTDFMERAAASGITQLPINSKAPWENGRTENAGYRWKLCMAKAVLNDPPLSDGEHLALAAQVTSSRNRCINRSGFSPIQRLLGFSPRLPASLLSDDPIDSSLLSQDPLADFQRSEELRRAATVAVAQSDAREGLARLSRAKHRVDLNCQNGDLVYVWRPKVTHGGKWVGPGVVIMAVGSTVWVSMRGAPWKCARSQLRSASSDEAMGVEIVNKHLWQLREALTRRSHRRGFVDVESEGPPDESAYQPEARDDAPTAATDGEPETNMRAEAAVPSAPSQANTALPSESAETPRSTRSFSSAPSEQDPKRPRLDTAENVDIPGLIAQYPDAGPSTASSSFQPIRPPPSTSSTRHLPYGLGGGAADPGRSHFLDVPVIYHVSEDTELRDSPAPAEPLPMTECFATFEQEAFYLKKKTATAELDVSKLPLDQRQLFDASRKKEIDGILEAKAITILSEAESERILRLHPERVLRSRYTEKYKAMDPGVPDIAKSRWCVLGFDDPDIEFLVRTSPAPESESIMWVLQLLASHGCRAFTADVKVAFMQGLRQQRKKPLYAMAPEGGFPGHPGALLARLETEVYGLVTGPVNWRNTMKTAIRDTRSENGFYRQNALESCVYTHFEKIPPASTWTASGWLVVEMDDLLGGGFSDGYWATIEAIKKRFLLGKFKYLDEGLTDYAGRSMTQLPDFGFELNMARYVEKRISPIRLDHGRGRPPSTLANEGEITGYRGLIGGVAWAAREGRPDVAGEVSILSSRLPNPTIEDCKRANKLLQELRDTPHITVKVKAIPYDDLRLFVCIDASKDNAKEGKSQTAYILGTVHRSVMDGAAAPASCISWKSRPSQRVCASTLMSEAYAISFGLAAAEWAASFLKLCVDCHYKLVDRDEVNKDIQITSLMRYPEEEKIDLLAITDAKSLFDNLIREATSSQEKRAALEICVSRESLLALGGKMRWIPHEENFADPLTKLSGNKQCLYKFLREATLSVKDEATELEQRKLYRERTGKANPRPNVTRDV